MKFIRQLIAKVLVYTQPEWGGVMYDYKNGLYEHLLSWSDNDGADQSMEIIHNMLAQTRDAIYTVCIKVGNGRGFLYVINSNGRVWSRAFWGNLYSAEQALLDISKIARKAADDMGFRRPA